MLPEIQERFLLNGMYSSREVYNKLTSVLPSDSVSAGIRPIYTAIEDYYSKDIEATCVDKAILISYLTRKHPKKVTELTRIVDGFNDDISTSNVLQEVLEYKRSTIAQEYGAMLMNPGASLSDITDKREKYDTYHNMMVDELFAEEEDSEILVAPDLEEDTYDNNNDKLHPITPEALSNIVGGGVPIHTHICMISRPNLGKSAFAISMIAAYLRRNYPVLVVQNEENSKLYTNRIKSRLLKISIPNMKGKWKSSRSKLKELGYENLVFWKASPGTFERIEELIVKHEPLLVVIDQVRKIQLPGKKSISDTEQLDKAGREVRRLTKKYPIITLTLTQAGDSATGKVMVTESDMFQNKTGYPGDTDILIGNGASENMKESNVRVLNVVRNKITGVEDYVTVNLNPVLSKYSS